jgi:hypothetical protein
MGSEPLRAQNSAGTAPGFASIQAFAAFDNALAESFLASLECEVLDRNHFRACAAVRRRRSRSEDFKQD